MDFETMVRRGLGRAVIYARENDISEHREFLLNACLYNISFDPQLEMTSRARYMFDLVRATQGTKFYSHDLIAALENPKPSMSFAQICFILGGFGHHGDETARLALYNTVAHDSTQHGFHPAISLVRMDRLPGLLHVMEHLGEHEVAGYKRSVLLEMLEMVTDEGEEEETLNAILQERPDLASSIALLRAVMLEKENAKPYVHTPEQAPDYFAITLSIQTLDENVFPGRYKTWGMRLDDETLMKLAEDTLKETEPQRLRRYLYLFDRRVFPINHEKLLEYALDPWEYVARPARRALEPFVSPSVRALAVNILNSHGNLFEAVSLLNRNYQEGD